MATASPSRHGTRSSPSGGTGSGTSPQAGAALVVLVLGYLLIDLLAGAPDSALVPPPPAGVRAPNALGRAAAWVGLDRVGRAGSTVLALATMAVLVAAFGVVVFEAWRGRVAWRWVLAAMGAALALSVMAPVLLSRDAFSYAAYGRMYALHGANPYVALPSSFPHDPFVRVASPAWVDARSVYGPAFTLVSAGIARTWSGSPGGTLLAFKVLAGVAAGGAALLAGAAAERVRPGRGPLAAVVVGLNPVIVVHTVGGGHNDASIAALLSGAMLLAITARGGTMAPLAVTGLLVLAALVKVVVGLALVVWVWSVVRRSSTHPRGRAALAHVGSAAAVTVALWLPFLGGWRAIGSLAAAAGREGWASGPRLVARGADAVGRAMAGSEVGDAMARAAYGLFLAVFAFLLWRVLARAERGRPADGWGPALLLFALAAPYLLPWYAAWFVPFLALLSEGRLALVGLAACGLLALTGIPAEPGSEPGLWRAMVLAVHYGVAPIVLLLFAAAALSVLRPGRP